MKHIKTNTIIWVDVDDVLVKFRLMFNKFLRENHGFNVPDDYLAKNWTYSEFIPEGEFAYYFESLPKNWTEHLECFSFVKNYLDEIHKMGHYIIFITAVPDHGVPFRIKNLINHQLYFDEIYFTSQDKSIYAKEILRKFYDFQSINNVIIDDRAKNCVDFYNNMPNMRKIISLNAPFNSKEINLNLNIDYKDSTELMWDELMVYLRNGVR